MSRPHIATVTIELRKEPGYPAFTVTDVAEWVASLMADNGEPEGPNTARYSEAVVTSVTLANSD